MEKNGKKMDLFKEINSIFNKGQLKEIDFYIKRILNSDFLLSVKKELFESAPKGSSLFFPPWKTKVSNYFTEDYVLSFDPECKRFLILFNNDSGMELKTSSSGTILNLHSPYKNKKLTVKISEEDNNIIKFIFNYYLITLFIFKNMLVIMVFNLKKFTVQEELIFIMLKEKYSLFINPEKEENYFDNIEKSEYNRKNALDKRHFIDKHSAEKLNLNTLNEINNVGFEPFREIEDDLIRDITDTEDENRKNNFMILNTLSPLSVELGLSLLSFVKAPNKNKFFEYIGDIRKFFASDFGVIIPSIKFTDNLNIKNNSYVIKIKNIPLASGEVRPDRYLVIGKEENLYQMKGELCNEPSYGMPAIWITGEDISKAEEIGCMVFDSMNVMTTHITETIRQNLHNLLGRQDTANLLSGLKKSHPALVEEIEKEFSLKQIHQVLRNLLREKVSIRDLVTIFETMGDFSHITVEPEIITEYVRQSLCNTICMEYQNDEKVINAIFLERNIEHLILVSIVKNTEGSYMNLDVDTGEKILDSLGKEIKSFLDSGKEPVLVCSAKIRPYLKKLTEGNFPHLAVLSYNEIAPNVIVNPAGKVSFTLNNYFSTFTNSIKKVNKIISDIKGFFRKTEVSEENNVLEDTELMTVNSIFAEKENRINFDEIKITEDVIPEENLEYILSRLDVPLELTENTLRKVPDPKRAISLLRLNLRYFKFMFRKYNVPKDIAEEALKKCFEIEDLITYLNHKLKSGTIGGIDFDEAEELYEEDGNYRDNEELFLAIKELKLDEKIKDVVAETGVPLSDAFYALSRTGGDVKSAINYIEKGEKGDNITSLLFEPLIWQKIEYILKQTSCNISDAFKALVECNEDEMEAVKLIKENKDKK